MSKALAMLDMYIERNYNQSTKRKSYSCSSSISSLYSGEETPVNSEESFFIKDQPIVKKKVSFLNKEQFIKKPRDSLDKLRKVKSFNLSTDSERIYDDHKNHKAAIEYKRYGQFLSFSNDADPEDKQIIDVFDLYNILKKHNRELKEKPKKTFMQKVKNIFKKF